MAYERVWGEGGKPEPKQALLMAHRAAFSFIPWKVSELSGKPQIRVNQSAGAPLPFC